MGPKKGKTKPESAKDKIAANPGPIIGMSDNIIFPPPFFCFYLISFYGKVLFHRKILFHILSLA